MRRLVQSGGANFGHVSHLQQAVDAAQFFQFALVQNGDSVADILHVGQQVAAHQHGFALVAEVHDHVLHLPRADRVQTGGGFVQEDQLGVVDQRLGEPDTADHSLGVFLQLPPLGPIQPDHLNQLARSLTANRARHVKQPTVEIERLLGVKEAVEVGFLGQVSEPLVFGHVGGVAAEDQCLSAGGEQEPQQQLDGGCFSRPVGAQQPEYLAAANFQVQGF